VLVQLLARDFKMPKASKSQQIVKRSEYSKGLSIEDSKRHLKTASEAISLRGGLTASEHKRVTEAVSPVQQLLVGDKHGQFLRKVYDLCGFTIVILCVVGLGRANIVRLRDDVLLQLPLSIKEIQASLESPTLLTLAQHPSYQTQPLLYGTEVKRSAFKITIQDVQAVLAEKQSEQMMMIMPVDDALLIEYYGHSRKPVIMMEVSDPACAWLKQHREHVL
jgi:hypothetical protein